MHVHTTNTVVRPSGVVADFITYLIAGFFLTLVAVFIVEISLQQEESEHCWKMKRSADLGHGTTIPDWCSQYLD